MRKHNKTGLAAMAFFGATVFATLAAPAHAAGETPREATVTVSGEGNASVAPDMAMLTFAVVQQAKTAREALDANSQAMTRVLDALKKAGVAERDLQTSGFGIVPQYNYPTDKNGGGLPAELAGYQVSNTLSVRVRDLGKLASLIDTSVTLGINQGGDIAFTNDKPQAVVTEARKAAVADAMEKAKVLTQAAGVKIGRIIDINETMAEPAPMPRYRAAMAKEMDASPVPVATGENTYNVTVTITFAIDQT